MIPGCLWWVGKWKTVLNVIAFLYPAYPVTYTNGCSSSLCHDEEASDCRPHCSEVVESFTFSQNRIKLCCTHGHAA